ncbi:MAG TPA: tetratricopeptide repeat protein [Albitalea sp.]|uniref:tetratricopeptide repeat protein n=1 Tax=Piscinibacter sp. TaxID=1903157 RepID=UPI002ED428CE
MTEHRALLLTDLVDSTSLSSRLGDAAMSALWRAHDRAARDLLRRWRGREIDKSDGFLLLFDSPADAVGFALEYHRAMGAMPIPVQARAGLHVGPVTLRENAAADVQVGAKPLEVDGLVKPIAARVMQLAQGGQTLLSADAAGALNGAAWRVQSHGHWRLKGIEAPFELYEVGEEDAPFSPPPDSDKAYRVVLRDDLWQPLRELRHSLPAERDAFIGRRSALHDLTRRLDEGARLVSVVGVGGTGKTRLAQRFGWIWLGDYAGGVWFCDLSQARTLDGVGHAVAQGLGVPLGKADPVSQIGNAIAGRGTCLVILDNFEQVCAYAEQTLGQWLDRAPAARFVVTTREVLGISGEDVLALAPLDPAEAATLFLRRAESARHDFRPTLIDQAAVDPLVRLLDGLPLAIELAAARVRVMPPRTLLQRMSERFTLLTSKGTRRDRQATLRAAFDWSWDLLSLSEKAALAQVSVFEGGFTLQAAEATIDVSAHPDAPSPIDVLQSLVDKSLVRQRADGRFDLLVSVQEYAAEHLRSEGRYPGSGPDALAAAQLRHCSFFSTLSEAEAVADACADLDNLVAACRQAVVLGDVASAVGALEGAWAALLLRGPYRAAVELGAMVRTMAGLEPRWLGRIDRVGGRALRACGRIAEAGACYEAALAAAREAGDRVTERRVLSHLGDHHVNAGRMDEARAELTAALALAREMKDRSIEAEALCGLGNLFEHLGSMIEARAHYEAALGVARDAGDRRWEGGSLGNLGLLCANEGRMAEARVYYESGLAIARELGDRQWEGNTLCNLGLLHQTQGRLDDARTTLNVALVVAKEMGYVRLGAVVMCNLGILYEAMQMPQEALHQYEAALEVVRELGDRRSQGQFLNYLGLLHARQGHFTQARACLNDAERLLVQVSDKLNLGILLCSRAETDHLSGDRDAAEAALARASLLAREVGAGPESEMGMALARMRQTLRPLARE